MAKKATSTSPEEPAVSDLAPALEPKVEPLRAEDLPYKGVDSNSIRVPASPSHTPYSSEQ